MAKEKKPTTKETKKGSMPSNNVSTQDPEPMQNDLEITDQYADDTEELQGVRMLHPNRSGNEKSSSKSKTNKRLPSTATEERSLTEAEELPGILYKGLFEQLASHSSDCCVTVYLPTHKSGVQVNAQQDRIAFKGMLQELRNQLQEKGHNQVFIDNLLEPGHRMLRDNDDIWNNMTEGMAIFMAADYFKFVRLPFTPNQEILLNHSFYISPLIPAMAGNEHFYLLAISQKRARFFRVDEFYMEEMDIPEMPNGMDDVVHFEEKDNEPLFRGNSLHAGDARVDPKESMALYMKEVDRVLWQKVLGREQAPLLIASVDYEIPIYKSVSSYQYICEDCLTGNYESSSNEELFNAAKEKMMPFFNKNHKTAIENYLNKLATPLTTSMPDAVIRASHYGQVADLFIEKGAHIWGHFDAQANNLQVHATQENNDDCLIDKAAQQTILHGGHVHVLEREEMPNGSTVAALLRYQV